MSNPRDKNQQDRSETIRGHLEAQVREGCIYGGACDHPDPMQCCPGCRARVRARAMLAILSEADEEKIEGPSRGAAGTVVRDLLPTGRRLVPDP